MTGFSSTVAGSPPRPPWVSTMLLNDQIQRHEQDTTMTEDGTALVELVEESQMPLRW